MQSNFGVFNLDIPGAKLWAVPGPQAMTGPWAGLVQSIKKELKIKKKSYSQAASVYPLGAQSIAMFICIYKKYFCFF